MRRGRIAAEVLARAEDPYSNGHDKWMIARIGTNDKIDQSFGEDGLIFFNDIGGGHDFATSVAIQSDGKILVGGHSWDINIPMLQYSTAIVRLNKDGSIDKSFGKSGLFRKRISAAGWRADAPRPGSREPGPSRRP